MAQTIARSLKFLLPPAVQSLQSSSLLLPNLAVALIFSHEIGICNLELVRPRETELRSFWEPGGPDLNSLHARSADSRPSKTVSKIDRPQPVLIKAVARAGSEIWRGVEGGQEQ